MVGNRSGAGIHRAELAVDAGGYTVTVGAGLLGEAGRIAAHVAPAHRYAIVTDSTVGALHVPVVARGLPSERWATFTIEPGEAAKTRATWAAVTDSMLERGFGRDTTVIAVGGGVVGDLAGFVAATFMRGVPVVQIPTTLLAMIDASVGGKTGVDTSAGKNLVGAFHPPAAVVIDPRVLDTLPVAEIRAGLAEALKHGVIADRDYFEALVPGAPSLLDPDPARRDPALAAGVIARSVQIKASVVREDERERGVRKILNFGHTIGHAIEHLSGYALRHGECVAIGMAVEARAAELAGIATPGTAAAIQDALAATGLPARRPAELDPAAILAATRGDKKSRTGVVEYALPAHIGAMAGAERGYSTPLADSVLLEALG